MSILFPKGVARVPDSLWCVGVEGVFARRCDCVRNRLQPFAWGPMAVPVTAGNCYFWRFQTSRDLVSCGRRGTSRHPNIFLNVSKLVLCDRRNTFASFLEDELTQAQHFGDLHRHFA